MALLTAPKLGGAPSSLPPKKGTANATIAGRGGTAAAAAAAAGPLCKAPLDAAGMELNQQRLQAMLEAFGEYPAKYRLLIWWVQVLCVGV